MKAIQHTNILVTPLRPETCNSVTRAIKNELTHIKKNARALGSEFARIFKNGDPNARRMYTKLFVGEALAKFHSKPEKFPLKDYVPSWMTSPIWTTGDRRTAAKLNAYGINRVGHLYSVAEENKPATTYKATELMTA